MPYLCCQQYFDPASCVSITNVHDEEYSYDSYYLSDCYFDCEDVWVYDEAGLYIEADHDVIFQSNILIEDDSNLIIDADGKIIIQSDFKLELGSTLITL